MGLSVYHSVFNSYTKTNRPDAATFWSSPICVGLVEVTMVVNAHLIYLSC